MPFDLFYVGDGVPHILVSLLPSRKSLKPSKEVSNSGNLARTLNIYVPAAREERQPLRFAAGAGGNLGDLGPSSRVGVECEGPRAHLCLYLRDLAGRYSFGLDRISLFPNRRQSSDCLPYLALKGK